MRLAILSCGPRAYSTRRLKAVALQRGHTVKVLDTLKLAIGPQIMEVNSSPGLEGIESCTEMDLAAAVIDCISACN